MHGETLKFIEMQSVFTFILSSMVAAICTTCFITQQHAIASVYLQLGCSRLIVRYELYLCMR